MDRFGGVLDRFRGVLDRFGGSLDRFGGSGSQVRRFCRFVAISVQFLHPLGIPFPPLGITFSMSLASEAEIRVCLEHLVLRSDFMSISDDIPRRLEWLKLGFRVEGVVKITFPRKLQL